MVASASDMRVFDRALMRRKRRNTVENFKDYAFLHEWANERLAERLQFIKREFATGVHIGPIKPNVPGIKNYIGMDALQADIIADEEFLPFADHSLDIITSTMTLHTVNDLPGALVQIRRALKPDGLFLAAMAGGETLHELRQSLTHAELALKGGISPRVYPFADKPQMGDLLQRAGFSLPVVDSEFVTVTYENIFKLFADLRGMGQGNTIQERSRAFAGKNLFAHTAQKYHETFAETDGRIPATFEMIFLLGWSPHDSQQKPLRPGSATTRLADALETTEIKTGLKAQP